MERDEIQRYVAVLQRLDSVPSQLTAVLLAQDDTVHYSVNIKSVIQTVITMHILSFLFFPPLLFRLPLAT